MRIEARAALLPLLLGWLLPLAAAQRVTDRPSPKAAPVKAPPASPPAKPAPAAGLPATARKSVKTTARRPDPLAARLLSSDEGLHVLAAALGSHIRHASGDDCSQLVHEIYARAGFPYRYANSWDLYDGTDRFHRVWTPHPGDLVVWQGHVGIVVSPREHLFFSKLSSTGQDIASYDDAYWRERGHARFFRYLKPEDALEGAAAPLPPRKAAARKVVEAEEDEAPPKPAAREVAKAEPTPGGLDGPSSDDAVAAAETSASLPAPPLVNARHPEPEQVRQAILKELLRTAPALSDAQAPPLSQPLVIFDELRVEHVRLEGDQGWAEVRIHQVGAVTGARAALEKRTHRAFWSLHRRDRTTWEVVTPQETTYLSREAAVPVLAHQLAVLTDHPGDADAGAPRKKSLARLLNLLLESHP